MASHASDAYFFTLKNILNTEFGEESNSPLNSDSNNNTTDPNFAEIQKENRRTVLNNPFLSNFLENLDTEHKLKSNWFSREKTLKSCD